MINVPFSSSLKIDLVNYSNSTYATIGWVDFIKYILEDIFYVTVNGVVARRDLNGNEIWRYNRSNNGYVSMDIDKEGNFIAGNTGNRGVFFV